MAVYTKLSNSEIAQIINNYDVDEFTSATPIAEGIENSNYLINCGDQKYIFTIFENRVENTELPFFVNLTGHLKNKGINCPVNLTDKNGDRIISVGDKKAALISFLEGKSIEQANTQEIEELGNITGEMHIAVSDFKEHRKNPMSIRRWTSIFEKIGMRADEIEDGLTKYIADEIYYLADAWPFGLPSGVIHADLFPDNVFFQDSKISGVIDFYFACTDFYAYDLAICINAWGIEKDQEKTKALIAAYEKHRKLEPTEKDAMQTLLRGAALRFLLTRIYDWFETPADALVHKKDPKEYLGKLRYWQTNKF